MKGAEPMKRIFALTVAIVLTVLALVLPASAEESETIYDTYIYGNDDNYGDGDPIGIPSVFSESEMYDGIDLGVGAMLDIGDIFIDGASVFICDTGNNRVLVFDTDFHIKRELKEFVNGGQSDTFSAPTGVFSNGETLLICDSANQRLLLFSLPDYSLLSIISKPQISVLEDENGEYVFSPLKAVMDKAGRFYVIAEGVNYGIVRLDRNGEFITFIGAPDVVPNLAQVLWKKIATKEQKERLQQFVPTEYDALLVDDDGFIYAASKTSATEAFVKLNSKGDNISPNLSAFGDASQSSYDNNIAPYFVDIAVDASGTAYLLDSKQGKIYAYSSDGNLMYAFGGNAYQKGAFVSASAIEVYGDRLYVTDQNKNTVTILTITEFGRMLHKAKTLYDENEYDAAYTAYQSVLEYSSSYTPAIVAIAHMDVQMGQTQNVLNKLKQIHDYDNYSSIFESLRNDFIRSYIIWIILGLAVVIAVFAIAKKCWMSSRVYGAIVKSDGYQKIKYTNYVMFHPFDGFWDVKHEKRGDMKTACILLAVFAVFYGVRAQYSGYSVTKNISTESNAIFEVFTILLPLAFWVISNWCFTTLMDGKGTLKDIFIATCYSLKPYIILSIPLFIMSHILVADEAIFYTVLNTISFIWMLGLMFFGMITIHDYTLSKGIITALLSIIGICLIIFILLLVISVGQNVLEYFANIYKELSLRSYN